MCDVVGGAIFRWVAAVPMCVIFPDVGECWPTAAFGLFFHGWNPLPTAASANGGGDLFDNLLHWAANIANGVLRKPGCSWNEADKNTKKININKLNAGLSGK